MDHALPNWDITHLYPSYDSQEIKDDITRITELVTSFYNTYYQRISNNISAETFVDALKQYENIEDAIGKIASYAGLIFSTDADDPNIAQVYQNINEFVQTQSSKLVFFTLALNQIDDALLQKLLSNKNVAYYEPWIRDIRTFKPYQLDEKLEQLLSDSSIASRQNWVRLYDTLLDNMEISIDDNHHTLTEALDLLSHSQEVERKKTALALSEAFACHKDQITLIYNTIIKDESVSDAWRGFKRPVSSRNVANMVEDDIVDSLAKTVTENFHALSERYYRIKATMLGKDALEFWDRNAPLPEANEKNIPWEDAKEIVLNAYRKFSPEMARLGQRFFDECWIDAPVKKGKTSGAFSHPVVPSAHPYILVNYQGKVRDVMTLAHELGHGVHQLLAAKQGALMADTPLTLAETASVFGEQLTFQYLLEKETDDAARKCLIASKVEDMLNTVIRQIAFYNFETRMHDARKQGEVSADAISEIWIESQRESFGNAINIDTNYAYYWTYISHFFHAPFYVYAYAFGDCLVNSLYAVYEEEKKRGEAASFEKKYLDMLQAGGTKRHKELLAPFNIDISHADFWQKGLNHISHMIDMLDA